MKKGDVSVLLRRVGLMKLTDDLRFYYFKFKKRKKNKQFLLNNPEANLPPDYLIYESFQIDYEEYYTKSKASAEWILSYFSKYISLSGIKVLDWGCGPGRIIRHMSHLLETGKVYGTDYNPASIEWCKNNLPGIEFNTNTLEAKLPYQDNYFNAIYGISIFTHLSEKMHFEWMDELKRILAPGGLIFLTSHGNAFIEKLTENESAAYHRGELIVRGMTAEGHRTYTAYHPKVFMEKLFEGMKILEHVETSSNNGKAQQDVWLVQKK
ncbi:MAG: class I SAM-dependent methyltransferase [Bacteroidetes bacterium]|nr:class I SAM-dependent methyltransferase [Bacteroidota bacterium]